MITGTTDWDKYYLSVPLLARLTRRYTRSVLLQNLRRHATAIRGGRIVELGGGNSFFAASIIAEFAPREYRVVDTNATGLEMLRRRADPGWPLVICRQNILDLPEDSADVAFSVGVVEHFESAARREAILSHVRSVRSGGCVIISFPVATILYRAVRALAELGGWWMFHDETPVSRSEVADVLGTSCDFLANDTLWPVVFTQFMVTAQRR